MKLGFVIPWFGMDIPGGAETFLRGLILHLKEVKGVQIDVLTTCVKEFSSDWNRNYYHPGVENLDGFLVRRFPIRKRDTSLFDKVNAKLMQGEAPLSGKEEQIYFKEMINSPALYQYVDRHQDEYSLFVFIPYMFGTTYYGLQIAPQKSVMIPCFHDESYIYLKSWDHVFTKIAGMIFLSEPEKELALRRFDLSKVNTLVMGAGVNTELIGSPERFRKKYSINEPFVLYAGRKDSGKRVDVLLRYFDAYKKRNQNNLKLVLIGGGMIDIPKDIAADVKDLGFVEVQDKYDAYSAALSLCQPSDHESFSLVIMESWLCKRPVIVNEHCEVTCNFAKTSNGGLYFENYTDFEGVINYYLSHSDITEQMGRNGREYVLDNFAWDVIVKKYMSYYHSLSE